METHWSFQFSEDGRVEKCRNIRPVFLSNITQNIFDWGENKYILDDVFTDTFRDSKKISYM